MSTRLLIECLRVPFAPGRSITFPSTECTFEASRPVLILRGDNASGKTTFLNVLSGHVRPEHGRAFLGDIVLSGRGPTWAARRGVVRGFQSPLLCSDLNVWENIALPLLHKWWRPSARFRPAVVERLSAIGLDTLADFSPAELSFGQRRLVELVRIQFQISEGDKRLVLLDEPLAGLDTRHRAAAFRIIRAVDCERTPIILVEHDLRLPELADLSAELRITRRDEDGCQIATLQPTPSPIGGTS